MNKIWYILVDGNSQGPWTFDELKANRSITPDTLAWKEGFVHWKKIRDIPELQALFDDSPETDETEENCEPIKEGSPQDGLVMVMDQREPPYILWLLVAFISLMYVLLRLYIT